MDRSELLRISNYYFENDYLTKKIASVPETKKRFLFVTDVHWDQFNTCHSPALIAHACDRLGLSTVINGGDVVEIQPNKDLGLDVIKNYTAEMLAAVGAERYFPVLGNHDLNTANVTKRHGHDAEETFCIPYDRLYDAMFSHTIPYVHADAAPHIDTLPLDAAQKRELHAYMKMHYYFDDPTAGIRYIHLVTGTGDNGIIHTLFGGLWGSRELYLQFDWLYETLLSTPSGYDIVLSGHRVISWTSTPSLDEDQVKGNALKACEMLTAAKRKGNMCVTNDMGSTLLDRYYPRGTHTYDFTKMPNIGKLLVMCGDMHWDHQCVTHYDIGGNYISESVRTDTVFDDGDVLVLCTQSDGYVGANYPDAPYGNKFHSASKGDITEQCFDIVSLEADRITLTRIGAGKDRIFRY